MKRLRRFDESSSNEIDAEYIRQCFSDLIDSGAVASVEERESAAYGQWVAISINLKSLSPMTGGIVNSSPEFISRKTSIGKYIDAYESNSNVYQEVKLALERLSDEYPNYKIKVEIYSSLFIYIYP